MKFRTTAILIGFPILLNAAEATDRHVPKTGYRDWSVYGGGPESIRYSNLDQINAANVGKLQVAWTFDTGDAFEESEMQCNPIIVNGLLFATTPEAARDRAGRRDGQAALELRSE